jgi:hypothetical protein
MPRENYGTERVNAQTMLIVFKKGLSFSAA